MSKNVLTALWATTYVNAGQIIEVHKDEDDDHPLEQYVWSPRYVHSPILRWRDGNTDGLLLVRLVGRTGNQIGWDPLNLDFSAEARKREATLRHGRHEGTHHIQAAQRNSPKEEPLQEALYAPLRDEFDMLRR